MPWYTSWLPGIPSFNFSIPSSIQGRFLSFLLKKSLGHLLKPGHFDYHQIDSQISSGYVQVNDLHLDTEAINTYIHGLPIALREGIISSIRFRIPWPNPLASTLGFSLKSLHLVFHVVPLSDGTCPTDFSIPESVASAAETFMHEQLSPREEASIWRSFHEDYSPELNLQTIPGALDTSDTMNDVRHKTDMDPAGVSIFAGLIERLLARFEFDAEDIKISLVHPDNVNLITNLKEIRYHTNSINNPLSPESNDNFKFTETRTLSITGFSVSTRNLSLIVEDSFLPDIPRPLSPSSDNSSFDEEKQFSVSQSIASLPIRPPSSSDSGCSSMYASAMSSISVTPQKQTNLGDIKIDETLRNSSISSLETEGYIRLQDSEVDEALLSFGSQQIIFQVSTSRATKQLEDDPFLPAPDSFAAEDALQVNLSIGIISCAFSPWQIHALLSLINMFSTSAQDSSRKNNQAMKLPPFEIHTQVRGIVALLLPLDGKHHALRKTSRATFFEKPLTLPILGIGYTRIHFASIFASLTCRKDGNPSDMNCVDLPELLFDFKLTDLSVFIIYKICQPTGSAEFCCFPFLLTDPHLPLQYPSPHLQPKETETYPYLPTFDAIDWTSPKYRIFGIGLSQWRYQPQRSKSSNHNSNDLLPLLSPSKPAIWIFTSYREGTDSKLPPSLEIHLTPVNIRIDLDCLFQPGGPVEFFEKVLSLTEQMPEKSFALDDKWFSEIRHHDHGASFDKELSRDDETDPKSRKSVRVDEGISKWNVSMKLPLVRLSIRCPPPPHVDERSGPLFLDLHDISFSLGTVPAEPTARFAEQDSSRQKRGSDMSEEDILVKVDLGRVVVGSSNIGNTLTESFASVGSLTDTDGGESYIRSNQRRPHISVIRPRSKKQGPKLVWALSVDIPAIHVNLSKPQFDSLQYWADDFGQFLDHMLRIRDPENKTDSGGSELIGSHFFTKSRGGSITSQYTDSAEFVVILTLTEAFFRILIPSLEDSNFKFRPLDIKTQGVDILLEVNPDGNQTVVTLGILDLVVQTNPVEKIPQIMFNLTSPRSLSTIPKLIVKLQLSTITIPEIGKKETRIKLTLCGFTYTFYPDFDWIADLGAFAKNPPGTFESVVPSDRTRISMKIIDGSVRLFAPNCLGAMVSYLQEFEISTDVEGDSRDASFHVVATSMAFLALDDNRDRGDVTPSARGISMWMTVGYALLAEVSDMEMNVMHFSDSYPSWKITLARIVLGVHLCADTLTSVTSFTQNFNSLFKSSADLPEMPWRRPTFHNQLVKDGHTIMSSVEDLAFKKVPEVGPAPDMIYDDLPTNLDYLDESFGAAGGLRELSDDDLDEFDEGAISSQSLNNASTISNIGGETIKIFQQEGLDVIDDYFLTLPPDNSESISDIGNPTVSVRVFDGHVNLLLYDGYDWERTRKVIEEEVKEMRKRLAKIKQLVANGQMQDPTYEDTSTLLFNSVHIGLENDEDVLGEPSALIAAIDEELKDDLETASQSSWQTLGPINAAKPRVRSTRVHGKRLTRSRLASIEFCLSRLRLEFDQYQQDDPVVSRTFFTVENVEILDHIKTSTWKKFLTELRSDSRGNVRETDSQMARVEIRSVRPVPGHSSEEIRLKAKILPLRLYVDQDAVDFLKVFFSFKDPLAIAPHQPLTENGETYIQLAEIFPVDLKLDYKPRRVNYRALKEGRTIELMNFFHFDGAEMTLRHITLAGITGWPRLFEMLNDLWTPDVKATQLVEVISGVSPIRSMVNVGSGVADLILLPIAQYKKDGRIVRGVQKGTTAFVKSTAIEAIKMGAKLATGTQVILEQAEGVLGGHFETQITTEPIQITSGKDFGVESEDDEESADMISKYARQPVDLREGVQTAYKSLRRNLSSAAQTILAVPMEVYERSGNEGAVRSVIRAVPIAVLKPMIGASEAVSKTLQGLHNTLDPGVRKENEAKYKLR